MNLYNEIVRLLGQFNDKDKKKKDSIHVVERQRRSKHMKKWFRATKAYADDRQKAPWNRRKHGMRKRK